MTSSCQLKTGFEELTSRLSNGITVSLFWNRKDDSLKVVVLDTSTESEFELEVGDEPALEVFNHPFAYAAFRGIEEADAYQASLEPA
jgi:hypothetical protein